MNDLMELGVAKKEKDFFQVALSHLLKERGRGSDTALAIDLGADQSTISRIKHGYSKGSVEMREAIGISLGTTYYDMMTLGKELKHGKPGDTIREQLPSYHMSILSQAARMMKQLDEEGDEESARHIFRTIEDVCKRKELDQKIAELERILKKTA